MYQRRYHHRVCTKQETNMDFQLLSATLEDRYPLALAEGVSKQDLLRKNFHEDCVDYDAPLKPTENGAIAFLFGRMENGKSICVRVEGIRPRLYFELNDTWTKKRIENLLNREKHPEVRLLQTSVKQFAHVYDYEPDDSSPSGRKIHSYLEVEFPSLQAFRNVRNLHAPRPESEGGVPELVAHEYKVEPLVRMFLDANIRPGGWCHVKCQGDFFKPVTTCDVEVAAKSLADVTPLQDRTLPSPYVHCYYDIETLGLEPSNGTVIQVSLVFEQGSKLEKHVVCLDKVSPLEGIHVHSCATEAEVLMKFRHLIIQFDPDFLVTYNGSNFDNNFLSVRADAGGAQSRKIEEFFYLSRFALRPSRLRELSLSSNGMGDNLLRYFETHGRENFDYFIKLKRDLPSEMSHKLGIMAKKFCNDDKEDMDYKQIPILQAGTPDDRARLASYCVHDSVLLARLNRARTMSLQILQFAEVFRIPPEWIYFRGQQVRFTTQLADKSRTVEEVPMIVNFPKLGFSDVGDGGYEGATVNEPKAGFYKKIVATLDWHSLYPSIMIAHNFCPSTLVRDPKLMGGEHIVEHKVSDSMTFHFATAHRRKGVLPFILEELLAQRNAVKKEMKKHLKMSKQEDLDEETRATHALLADVCDGKQLAIKVSCNSVYGSLGASFKKGAPYPCMAASAATTFRGRDAMVIKKQFLPQRYPGIDIIYGDSVAHYTPMLIRFQDRNVIVTPEELWDHWGVPVREVSGTKEAAVLTGVSTWTERGWTLITTIVRHRAGKPMYRVATPTGVVDVTEDHSLLRPDGTPCTAQECLSGDGRLLHAFPPPPPPPSPSPDKEGLSLARILGFFVGDGWCGCYQTSSGVKYTWALNNPNREILDRYREDCNAVFGHSFQILETLHSSYKLVPNGDLKTLTLRFREMCYANDGRKKIPDHILNKSSLWTAFLEGIYDADGVRGCESATATMRAERHTWQSGSSIDQTSERVALGLFYILRGLGYNVSIGTLQDKTHMYRLRWTRQKLRNEETVVESCTRLEYDPNAYVYDLTSENSHFHAGVGQMIVHNTDSVMVTFDGVYDVQECGNLAAQAADDVTAEFARRGFPQMVLEFEKCFKNYCLFKKKRYLGLKYEPDGNNIMKFKCIDAKGVETERTDALPFLKEIYFYVREAVLEHSDPHMALERFNEKMRELISGKVAFEKLIMGRKLSSKVVEKTDSIAHAKVNAMRREREAGSEESVGDRVEYVIINDHKSKKTTEMAEDPVFARTNNLKLNLKWYFEHKIEQPMATFFSIFHDINFKATCDKHRAELERERLGIKSLREMFGGGGGGTSGGGASSSSNAPPPSSRHVMAPPAPRKRIKK